MKEYPHGGVMKRKRYLAIWRTEESEYQQIVHSDFDIADENDDDEYNNDASSCMPIANNSDNDNNQTMKSEIKVGIIRAGEMITLGSSTLVIPREATDCLINLPIKKIINNDSKNWKIFKNGNSPCNKYNVEKSSNVLMHLKVEKVSCNDDVRDGTIGMLESSTSPSVSASVSKFEIEEWMSNNILPKIADKALTSTTMSIFSEESSIFGDLISFAKQNNNKQYSNQLDCISESKTLYDCNETSSYQQDMHSIMYVNIDHNQDCYSDDNNDAYDDYDDQFDLSTIGNESLYFVSKNNQITNTNNKSNDNNEQEGEEEEEQDVINSHDKTELYDNKDESTEKITMKQKVFHDKYEINDDMNCIKNDNNDDDIDTYSDVITTIDEKQDLSTASTSFFMSYDDNDDDYHNNNHGDDDTITFNTDKYVTVNYDDDDDGDDDITAATHSDKYHTVLDGDSKLRFFC